MWILYGIRLGIGHPDEEDIVAKFSSKELAEQYIKKASLKKSNRYSSFKKKSLLDNYYKAYVEYEDEYEYEIDPVF